ncbi:MAG: UTP--glucose-1-phosphate uridylyltransferase, partial [Endomicrobium sp.]|nr:UTP--glucose-1-phosphate uridylyltransferase [Endomicrobium sp.]
SEETQKAQAKAISALKLYFPAIYYRYFEADGKLAQTTPAQDRQALSPPSFSPIETDLAEKYSDGKITTAAISKPIRPVEKQDVANLRDLPRENQLRLIYKGMIAFMGGRVMPTMLAAGASSRMNTAEAPQDVKAMVDGEINSKAAVPIERLDNGQVITYEDAFFGSLAALARQIEALAKEVGIDLKMSDVRAGYMSNASYEEEQRAILEKHGFYGLNPANIRSFNQPLGVKFVANISDVRKKAPQEFKSAADKAEYFARLAYSADIKTKVDAGDAAAAIVAGEKDPWGHGEYFHQLIASGEFLYMLLNGIDFITVKNVDNYAAKFDEQYLMELGYLIELKEKEGVDGLFEVSEKSPGLKGGDWGVYLETGSQFAAEQPTLVATREAGSMFIKGDFKSFAFNDAVGLMTTDYIAALYMKEGQTLQEFINEMTVALEQASKGNRSAVEAIAQRGREKFPMLIDAKPGKKKIQITITQELIDNISHLLSENEINELKGMIGQSVETAPFVAKTETNMWQSTMVTDRKVRTVKVDNGSEISIISYMQMNWEQKKEVLKWFRFLATKQWDKNETDKAKAVKEMNAALGYKEGDAYYIKDANDPRIQIGLETFFGNALVAKDLLRYMLEENLYSEDFGQYLESVVASATGIPNSQTDALNAAISVFDSSKKTKDDVEALKTAMTKVELNLNDRKELNEQKVNALADALERLRNEVNGKEYGYDPHFRYKVVFSLMTLIGFGIKKPEGVSGDLVLGETFNPFSDPKFVEAAQKSVMSFDDLKRIIAQQAQKGMSPASSPASMIYLWLNGGLGESVLGRHPVIYAMNLHKQAMQKARAAGDDTAVKRLS